MVRAMSTEDERLLGFNGIFLAGDEINGDIRTDEITPGVTTALSQFGPSISRTFPLNSDGVISVRKEKRAFTVGNRTGLRT